MLVLMELSLITWRLSLGMGDVRGWICIYEIHILKLVVIDGMEEVDWSIKALRNVCYVISSPSHL